MNTSTAPYTETIQTITPELAQSWLRRNRNNRPVSPAIVTQYARDMSHGRWALTGEAIRFDRDRNLLDGQHRLHAIIAADQPITLPVQVGIDPAAQAFMDTGKGRTAADALTIQGTKNASAVGATARLAFTYAAGRLANTSFKVSNAEIIDWIAEHPEVHDAAAIGLRYSRLIDCPPSIIAFTLLELRKIDAADADAFWAAAAEKVGLAAGDPALTLANRFADARRSRKPLRRDERVALVFRAWNHRRAGTRPNTLKLIRNEAGVIVIPEPTR